MEPNGAALVTGASRGIGRAVAIELGRRGFEVLAGVRDSELGRGLEEEAHAAGCSLRATPLDVTAPESVALPADLRVLVNNAGVDARNDAAEDTTLEAWRALFETNVFGAVALTHRVIPVLRAAGGGVICNITSASLLVPMPFFSVYRASKAALSAFGESLRSELAPHGIRLLEVLPGAIDTDMLAASEAMPEAAANAAYRAQAELVAHQRSQSAGEPTSAEDAARAIVDAVLDDTSPLRVGCDPMGAGLLAAWRSQSDEDMMRPLVAAFTPERGPGSR